MSGHLESVIKLIEQSKELSADEKRLALSALEKTKQELHAFELAASLETSLEKMRHKTMKMRNSGDVAETVALMFQEMTALGVKTIRAGIGIMKENMRMEIWTSNAEAKQNAELIAGVFDMNSHLMFREAYQSWENGINHYPYHLKGNDLVDYYTAINNMKEYKTKYDLNTVPKELFHNSFLFAEGALFVFSLEKLPKEICGICERFAGVFGQTYRRYLDLQEAEEQKMKVEEKHKEILDSINYAKRIQSSLLPTEAYLKRVLS